MSSSPEILINEQYTLTDFAFGIESQLVSVVLLQPKVASQDVMLCKLMLEYKNTKT